MRTLIEYAKLDWGEENAPRSFLFDDIYFAQDGPAESRHVFLAGNDLPSRFEQAEKFTIGEIGFGTGLNFLAAWDAWERTEKPPGARLHFLSVEKFPFAPDDLAKAHEAWPQYASKAARLRAVTPPAFAGVFQCDIAQDVTLTLIYGDALRALGQAEAAINAWFLDGFAPAKNPDLWDDALMAEVTRLSAPAATFATFTVAGAVRRSLTSAGFDCEKRAGFGRKREMLAGRLRPDTIKQSNRAPWFTSEQSPPLDRSARIAIIGAGGAGAALAHALRRHGYAPTIFEASAPASGASGNPAGLIMPRLDVDDTPAGRFHAAAYLHTVRLLTDLPDHVFDPCGVTRRATGEKEAARQHRLLSEGALPAGWMTPADDGLTFPQGGVVDPAAFVSALIADTPVVAASVTGVERSGGNWLVATADDQSAYDAVIIANALDALRFSQLRSLPLTGSAGQIDWFPQAAAPASAIAFGPYAAPCPRGGLVIGATYAPIGIGAIARFTPEATQTNIAAVAKELPEIAGTLDPAEARPRASVRCTTPDRLPVAGPVPDWGYYAGAYDGLRTGRKEDYPPAGTMPGLYALTGLGSRGLVTAPLCAAVIAAEIAGAPSPVFADIAEALHPARFFIRDMKRGN